MKKIILICCCFWLCTVSAHGQIPAWETVSKENMAKVFEQISNWLKNSTNYSVKITHASFENYSTETPFEKSVGYFKKENENYRKKNIP